VRVLLNHTIAWCCDRETRGLPTPEEFGPFLVAPLMSGVSLDFRETADPITSQHDAFLIGEGEFDQISGRHRQINRADGGRSSSFHDPDGQFLEVITRPYGSVSRSSSQDSCLAPATRCRSVVTP
jgi:hypothetical protein